MSDGQFGYIDVEYDELKKYLDAIEKKKYICEIMTSGRISFTSEGPKYNGLVCSPKMGDRQTGISAEWCKNCVLAEEQQ